MFNRFFFYSYTCREEICYRNSAGENCAVKPAQNGGNYGIQIKSRGTIND